MRFWVAIPLVGVGACGGVGLEDYDTGGTATVELVVVPKGTTDFGEVSQYGEPEVETFTMSTKGDERTSIVSIDFDGTTGESYTLDLGSLTFPRPLQAGTNLAVNVEFLPLAGGTGTRGGVLVIEYETDKAGNTATVERQLVGEACDDQDHDGDCD